MPTRRTIQGCSSDQQADNNDLMGGRFVEAL
jgi:hypothetical protein